MKYVHKDIIEKFVFKASLPVFRAPRLDSYVPLWVYLPSRSTQQEGSWWLWLMSCKPFLKQMFDPLHQPHSKSFLGMCVVFCLLPWASWLSWGCCWHPAIMEQNGPSRRSNHDMLYCPLFQEKMRSSSLSSLKGRGWWNGRKGQCYFSVTALCFSVPGFNCF